MGERAADVPKILSPGTRLGEFKLVGKVRGGKKTPPYKKHSWRVECSCGTRLTLPEWYLVRPSGPKRHCGCKVIKTLKTIQNREYRIWCMMHQRCLFPQHQAYKDYGGRGIKICYDWLSPDYGGNPDGKGFDRFFEFIGQAPTIKHSIDRVDVNGNYEPYHPITKARQVRWATAVEQAANKRK